MTKNTLRRFTLLVPTGQMQTQQIRTFVRAADGTEYPVDREIEVPELQPATVEVDFAATGMTSETCTEAFVLAQFPEGARVMETRDIVTVTE